MPSADGGGHDHVFAERVEQAVNGTPTGAMSGHDDLQTEFLHILDSLWNNLLERPAGEVKPAHHTI